jgi:hypothetical protein
MAASTAPPTMTTTRHVVERGASCWRSVARSARSRWTAAVGSASVPPGCAKSPTEWREITHEVRLVMSFTGQDRVRGVRRGPMTVSRRQKIVIDLLC